MPRLSEVAVPPPRSFALPCASAVKSHSRKRSGVSVRFVKNRRKSLSAKRIQLQTNHAGEWLFCKTRAADGNLKICLYGISTYGRFCRRWGSASHCPVRAWVGNGRMWDGPKWSLKVLFIFKFGSPSLRGGGAAAEVAISSVADRWDGGLNVERILSKKRPFPGNAVALSRFMSIKEQRAERKKRRRI